MTLVAHAGHWITSIAYFVPVLGFLIWLGLTTWRDRHRQRTQEDPDSVQNRRDD
jgi:threonine/homoserine/homoserine lactone efflux protein